jgi:hypothetical protein
MIISWMTQGFSNVCIFSRKSLWDFEKEYGFLAEQGRRSRTDALAGFSNRWMTRSWNRRTSGRFNASFVVASKGCFRTIGVRSSKNG